MEPDNPSLPNAYIQTVQSSRATMNIMLNIMRDQDRTLRESLRDNDRITRETMRIRGISPSLRPMNLGSNPSLYPSDPPSHSIPYAPPHQPAWELSSDVPRRRTSFNPIDRGQTILGIDPPRPRPYEHGYLSTAQRLRLYRDHVGRQDAPPRIPDPHFGDSGYRSIYERYPILGDLSPVRLRPTLREMAVATRETQFGDIQFPINTTCPITHEAFNPRDTVIQILQCRHIFTAESLRQWFESNVRCPVCRHDIREPLDISGISPPRTTVHDESPSLTNPEGQISDGNSDNPRDTGHQVDSATQSIMEYISNDIQTRIRESGDLSGNVMIEYGFVVPPGSSGPALSNVQVREGSPEDDINS